MSADTRIGGCCSWLVRGMPPIIGTFVTGHAAGREHDSRQPTAKPLCTFRETPDTDCVLGRARHHKSRTGPPWRRTTQLPAYPFATSARKARSRATSRTVAPLQTQTHKSHDAEEPQETWAAAPELRAQPTNPLQSQTLRKNVLIHQSRCQAKTDARTEALRRPRSWDLCQPRRTT